MELLRNSRGEISTTNCVQVVSLVSLLVMFFLSAIYDFNVNDTLAIIIGGIALGTPLSKGLVTRNREELKKDYR